MTREDLKQLEQIADVQLRLADTEILKICQKVSTLRVEIDAATVNLRSGAASLESPPANVDMSSLKNMVKYQSAMRIRARKLEREIDHLQKHLNQARRRRAMADARRDIIRRAIQAKLSKLGIDRENAQSEQVLDLIRLAKANH